MNVYWSIVFMPMIYFYVQQTVNKGDTKLCNQLIVKIINILSNIWYPIHYSIIILVYKFCNLMLVFYSAITKLKPRIF